MAHISHMFNSGMPLMVIYTAGKSILLLTCFSSPLFLVCYQSHIYWQKEDMMLKSKMNLYSYKSIKYFNHYVAW